MSSVTGSQTHCARCRVRFAQPLHGRTSVICEDCENAEAEADQLVAVPARAEGEGEGS